MRKIITTISVLLCLQSTVVLAQPYKSIFGSNTSEWIYRWGSEFGIHNDTAYVQKDTLVNGVVYKLLLNSYYWQSPWCLLREDVNTGTVWCRSIEPNGHPDDTLERIAVRMDLKVGDTFDISNIRLHAGTYPDSFNVVDSIRYINGLKHIYFKGLYIYSEPYTLIEGVGSNMGIFWKYAIQPFHSFTGGFYLLCSYKSGIKTGYENKQFKGACWIGTGVDDVEEVDDITIYPQPAYSKINIKNPTNQAINKVEIINQIGKVVQEVSNPVITQLDISNIPAGYYLLKLYTTGGYLATKPLLITK